MMINLKHNGWLEETFTHFWPRILPAKLSIWSGWFRGKLAVSPPSNRLVLSPLSNKPSSQLASIFNHCCRRRRRLRILLLVFYRCYNDSCYLLFVCFVRKQRVQHPSWVVMEMTMTILAGAPDHQKCHPGSAHINLIEKYHLARVTMFFILVVAGATCTISTKSTNKEKNPPPPFLQLTPSHTGSAIKLSRSMCSILYYSSCLVLGKKFARISLHN